MGVLSWPPLAKKQLVKRQGMLSRNSVSSLSVITITWYFCEWEASCPYHILLHMSPFQISLTSCQQAPFPQSPLLWIELQESVLPPLLPYPFLRSEQGDRIGCLQARSSIQQQKSSMFSSPSKLRRMPWMDCTWLLNNVFMRYWDRKP